MLRGTPVFYFFTTGFSHFLDFLMQGLWNETQTSPLEARYWSCVPYLLGRGPGHDVFGAAAIAIRAAAFPACRCWPSPTTICATTMVKTLAEQDVEFDFMVQVQTDPYRMPIEDAGVRWPERLSPFVPVATLRIPRQKFDSHGAVRLRATISPTRPGTASPEHRPLGNQSRARRRMYWELCKLRQTMNGTPHIEPDGSEVFG